MVPANLAQALLVPVISAQALLVPVILVQAPLSAEAPARLPQLRHSHRLLQVGREATLPPLRRQNSEVRPRDYLTPVEVETLCKAARGRGRYGHRDATMILIAHRHGLRVSELVALRWDQVDFAHVGLHVNRA
jgi:integrase